VISAKDKIVRYRATQIVAHVVNTLDSIDDDLFQLVRLALLKRLRDKESNIRVQAVLGLGRLADEGEAEDDEENSDDEDSGGVLSRLLDVLQHDPSADVRKSLLLNLPFTPTTLPYLLERARDLDAATRRALYSRLLPALGDFRHLSLTHREKLLRWGLRDRDENVRKATARLFRERWIEDCAASHAKEGEEERDPQKISDPNTEALLELLERIDVVNSGVETGIAHEAMKEFWDGRPDYRNFITFEDPYFDELTAEAMFIARTFNKFCKDSGDAKLESLREDKMPEVTKFAFLLQRHITRLIQGVEQVALNPDNVDLEEDTVQQEFCVEQLLHIALTLDYSDEMGRRKMFSVMREALALAELPEECTKLVVDVLRIVCGSNMSGEQEFCSIVLEAVAEVHDTIMGEDPSQNKEADESFHSARSDMSVDTTPTKKKRSKQTPELEDQSEMEEDKAVREIMVNMKCLHIAQCMLQNVQCDLEQNSHLVTMLNNLVVPAVRSQEAPIRERGLICLGLCCLLSKNLAQENLTLFLHCFAKGHEALQIIAIQIVSDMLTSHPSLLAQPSDPEAEPNQLVKPIYKMFSKSLRVPDNGVQTNGCVALSKLMLMGTIRDPDLLKQMVLAYFDPETKTNPSLRQSLTYFLPVYCHSKRENAEALARVAVSVIHTLADRADDLDEEEEMVGMNLVAAQLCDWTDPRKLVPVLERTSQENQARELDGHIVLAEEILEKILSPGCSSKYIQIHKSLSALLTSIIEEERKHYTPILGKLVISLTAPVESLQSLSALISEALESRLSNEAAVRNALNKLNTSVNKALSTATSDGSHKLPDVADNVDPSVNIPDAMETDVVDANDLTMLTRPDHEGTVFPDFDEEDEEEEEDLSETVDVTTGLAKRHVEDSLVESLLEDDDTVSA
jgi:condensin complex subunit 3